jgi:hypothetical protein
LRHPDIAVKHGGRFPFRAPNKIFRAVQAAVAQG